MKRCPKCYRFGVEYNPYTKKELCPWSNCLWTNETDTPLKEKEIHLNFNKFQKAVKFKTA